MNITIFDYQDHEPEFLDACIRRAKQHENVLEVRIYVNPRETRQGKSNPCGWIEYIMMFLYKDGGTLTVGAIQRELHGEMEFHS